MAPIHLATTSSATWATKSQPANLAYQQLLTIIQLLERCVTFCGMKGIFQTGYRHNLGTFCCLATISSYIALTIYSLYQFRGDYPVLLQSLCVDGIVVAGAHKLYIALRRQGDIARQLQTVKAIYVSNPRGRRQRLLQQTTAETARMSLAMIGMTLIGVIGYGMWPVYANVVLGQREMLMTIVCPWVDHRTGHGFLILNGVQSTCAIFGITGNLAFDLFVQVLVCCHRSMTDLLDDSMRELCAEWAKDGQRSPPEKAALRRRTCLRNIAMAFQETESYIKLLNDMYHSLIFTQVAALSASMVLCLFCITVNKWMGGVGFMIFALVLFLSMSFVGTILQNNVRHQIRIPNSEMCDNIYAAAWYQLPVRDQRQVLMLLMKSQRNTELWIGPVAPLNVQSAMQVLKSIYQIFMMMLESV